MAGEREPVRLLLLAVGLGIGGTETHVLELATRLDRRRFAVTVCSLKGEDVIAAELRRRGVRVVTLGGRGKLDVRVLVKLWRLVRQERPDIIHAFLFWANLAGRVVGRWLHVPVRLSSYHDVAVGKIWHRMLPDRLTLSWTHAMVCCSEAVCRSVRAQIDGPEGKYLAIPFGVDVSVYDGPAVLKRRDLGLRDDVAVIGTVCRLVEPKKGLAVLLQAVARLRAQETMAPFQLVIVGDGPARTDLLAQCEKLGITPWVFFAGARRDIPDLMPVMDIFVLPSFYEGFGIAIIEAMAAGRPVVSTAVGGILEVVAHGVTGLLVPPGDPDALAEALRRLVLHPEEAARMGERGRDRVRSRFSIESVVARHEELYDACMKQAAPKAAGEG